MLGFPYIWWGYTKDVQLYAKYRGLEDTEKISSNPSFEYLGYQKDPKTILELANMDGERYNCDVTQAQENLVSVIRDMQPRTKLVKYRIVRHFMDEKISGGGDEEQLEEIIKKYYL